MVKEMLEALMKEEREIYLEQHSTKANGYYIHDFLSLVGPVEDLKVPHVRDGKVISIPGSSPTESGPP
jgi:hypothetical protein